MQRNSKLGQFIYWTPRILAIIFVIFLSMFALDVFQEGHTFWVAIGAFIIHLIPTFIVILAIGAAWKNETIGGMLFFLLGFAYLIMAWGEMSFLTYLVMIGPVFLTGFLFMLSKGLRD